MSAPRAPSPAKLVVSVLGRVEDTISRFHERMEGVFGPADFSSDPLPFDWTAYYEREMGAPLFRKVVAFERLVPQDSLSEIKLRTNGFEEEFSVSGKRSVNGDPGLLTLGRFVLATGKETAHRIYLGRGIFADLTLIYEKGSFRPLPWTYSDYAGDVLIGILNRLRQRYKAQLRERRVPHEP